MFQLLPFSHMTLATIGVGRLRLHFHLENKFKLLVEYKWRFTIASTSVVIIWRGRTLQNDGSPPFPSRAMLGHGMPTILNRQFSLDGRWYQTRFCHWNYGTVLCCVNNVLVLQLRFCPSRICHPYECRFSFDRRVLRLQNGHRNNVRIDRLLQWPSK